MGVVDAGVFGQHIPEILVGLHEHLPWLADTLT